MLSDDGAVVSGRFILGLTVVALLISVCFLLREISAVTLVAAFVLAMLFGLGQIARQLFADARWSVRWIARQIRHGRSGARTTPDRSGP